MILELSAVLIGVFSVRYNRVHVLKNDKHCVVRKFDGWPVSLNGNASQLTLSIKDLVH